MNKESYIKKLLGNITPPEYLQPNAIELIKHAAILAKNLSNSEDIINYSNNLVQSLEKILDELNLLAEPIERLTPFWNAVQDAVQCDNILTTLPEISKQIDIFNKDKSVSAHKNIQALQIKHNTAISFFSCNNETYAQVCILDSSTYGPRKKVLDCDITYVEYYASLFLNRPLDLAHIFLGHDAQYKRHFFGFNLRGIEIYDTQLIDDYLIPNGNSGILWTAAE